ncbi:MAG: hypothetical protein ACKOQ6_08035 [Bacteroidota bacterium]
MKSRVIAVLLFAFSISTFYGCEKYEYLQSEKKIEKQLKGSWELVRIPLRDQAGNELPRQRWTFTDDRIFTQRSENYGAYLDYDNAAYTIETKLMKVLFYTNGFKPLDELDADWTVVRLDEDFLIIATDYYDSKGVRQLEFTRVK